MPLVLQLLQRQREFSILSLFRHLTLSLSSSSVTDHILHAAVSRVCDAQPGGLHPLLPERSAGQLSGRLSAGETNWAFNSHTV